MHRQRVLVAVSGRSFGSRAARRVAALGDDVTLVYSAAEARAAAGVFDRGLFALDLPDASGVVLAAELMLESRIGVVEFFHPHEEVVVIDQPGVGRAAARPMSEGVVQNVA